MLESRTDADCLDYLEWLRWPAGFACADCGHDGGWRLGDGRFRCSGCGGRSSVTAGTIFDRTRTPLTVWFNACWLFATGKDGISALSLKRTLEIGSYQTAWANRLRSVLVRRGRDRLAGMVEVDETYIGGEQPGLAGGRARGKKVLTGIAVEVREPGLGRCRMLPLADASAASLHPFVTDHVEPGATVFTDGWQGYHGLEKLGYVHARRSQRAARARGEDTGELLPAVHRVASLAKRWLLGTHQGSVEPAHLASYLDEFVFRFNRRRSRSRGMVFYRSNSPLPTSRYATRTLSPPSGPGRCRPRRPRRAGTRRAWIALQRTAPGELPARMGPVKWIPQMVGNHPRVANSRAVTAKERSRHTNAGNNRPNRRWPIASPFVACPDRCSGPLLCSHGSVIGGSDNHGRRNRSFVLEWRQLGIPPVEDHVHHGLVAAQGHLVGFFDLGIVQTVCDQALRLQQPLRHQ